MQGMRGAGTMLGERPTVAHNRHARGVGRVDTEAVGAEAEGARHHAYPTDDRTDMERPDKEPTRGRTESYDEYRARRLADPKFRTQYDMARRAILKDVWIVGYYANVIGPEWEVAGVFSTKDMAIFAAEYLKLHFIDVFIAPTRTDDWVPATADDQWAGLEWI